MPFTITLAAGGPGGWATGGLGKIRSLGSALGEGSMLGNLFGELAGRAGRSRLERFQAGMNLSAGIRQQEIPKLNQEMRDAITLEVQKLSPVWQAQLRNPELAGSASASWESLLQAAAQVGIRQGEFQAKRPFVTWIRAMDGRGEQTPELPQDPVSLTRFEGEGRNVGRQIEELFRVGDHFAQALDRAATDVAAGRPVASGDAATIIDTARSGKVLVTEEVERVFVLEISRDLDHAITEIPGARRRLAAQMQAEDIIRRASQARGAPQR